MMNGLYLIPGSPCCGKSTLAHRLAEQHGLNYVCCDDYESEFLARGQKENISEIRHLAEVFAAGGDAMWLRSPEILFANELAYYEISFPWLMEKIMQISRPLIAEGAALLPHRVRQLEIPRAQVLCMTPAEDFQRQKYALREWIAPYLAVCSDPDKAFDHWMTRDAMMARFVRQEAQTAGYEHWLIDGTESLEEIFQKAEQYFQF